MKTTKKTAPAPPQFQGRPAHEFWAGLPYEDALALVRTAPEIAGKWERWNIGQTGAIGRFDLEGGGIVTVRPPRLPGQRWTAEFCYTRVRFRSGPTKKFATREAAQEAADALLRGRYLLAGGAFEAPR